jgi:hypothetical protein
MIRSIGIGGLRTKQGDNRVEDGIEARKVDAWDVGAKEDRRVQ